MIGTSIIFEERLYWRDGLMNNRCVCCGKIIPEGQQVCYLCMKRAEEQEEEDLIYKPKPKEKTK